MPKKKGKKKGGGGGGGAKAAAPAPAPAPAADEPEYDVAKGKKGDAAKSAKQLDSVTDGFASGGKESDAATAKAAMAKLGGGATPVDEAQKAQRERAAKLAKIKLKPEDVTFFMENCCVEKAEAEKSLREAEGDLKAALVAFCES